MKTARLFSTIYFVSSLCWGSSVIAASSVEQIENEIKAFQNFFFQRFPDVSIDKYINGSLALPQFNYKKQNRTLLTQIPPYAIEMNLASKEWNKPFQNGLNMDTCFSGFPAAHEFPYFFEGAARTIVSVIVQCLNSNDEPEIAVDSARMARLVAQFKNSSNNQKIQIDYSSPKMRDLYTKGKKYFWSRRGQNNFSCASCHIDNAGNQLRSDVLSPALGSGAAYPAYSSTLASMRWSRNPWRTLHQRYAACHVYSAAAAPQSQSEEYIALEVYQTILNSGIRLKAPAFRR